MLRFLAYLSLIVTLTSCSYELWFGKRTNGEKIVPIINAEEVSRIIIVFSEKLRFDHELRLEDSVLYYDTRINRIRIDFSSMENIYLWEARALLVDVVEGLLSAINSNGLIFPHLARMPMTPNDLEIYITFESFYNKYVDLQTIGLITLRKGIANYFAADALDCDTPCWHRRSEYYVQSRNFSMFKREGEQMYKPRQADLDYIGRDPLGEDRQLPQFQGVVETNLDEYRREYRGERYIPLN